MELPFERKERKVLIKNGAETNSNFGCRPEDRPVEDLIKYGIINLDKPSGPTSHQVTDYVKKILNIRKAGHSGTLDPKVTGVLPIALDSATRIVQVLLSAGKEYVCLMHIHKEVTEKEIKGVFEKFKGKIKQVPPKKSAVKRQEREREIYYIEIMEIDGQDVLFRIGCQAGTYIRKICHDLGRELKVGAHMKQLIRTKAGPFSDKDMINLHDLKDAYEFWKSGSEEEIRKCIKPFEMAVEHLPKVWVLDGAVEPVCHGTDLYVPGISKLNDKINKWDLVAVFTLKNELVCIGKAEMTTEEILENEKGIAIKADKVFMERGTYGNK
ncbi:RNA-guided pseudouridylation complex pseudouridine synthase subunit Cbf5 [Candidatus Woesearchaeota archaeon]|nr:RNA-guided pseudouridylation complex pseudouridine synthase subunit Cbf5 [Candidatus Woesearchaeota archaeon]